MGGDRAAVLLGALHRAAPALRLPAARRQRRHLLPVDRYQLRVVARRVVEYVFFSFRVSVFYLCKSYW